MHPSDYDHARVTKLWAYNYRSLDEDVEVEFGPVTALVGPNGSGKSNLLDALRFVRDALIGGLEIAVAQRLGIDRLRRAAATRPRGMSVAVLVEHRDWKAIYDFSLGAAAGGHYRVNYERVTWWDSSDSTEDLLLVRNGKLINIPDGLAPTVVDDELTLPSVAAHPRFRPLVEALRSMRIYSIYPRELSAPQPVGKTPPLDDQGSNWAAVLRSLSAQKTSELVAAVGKVLPDVVGLGVTTAGGYHTVYFSHRLPTGQVRHFDASQESDGTLRIAALLTALLQDEPPALIGIEEPELTVNPGLLPLLLDFIREASERSPVVITSHSPDLLDLVTAEEVRVVERTGGITTAGPIEVKQREVVKASLMGPGGLMRTGGLTREGGMRNLIDEVEDSVTAIGRPRK
ncbi:AAA family ATPase [Modestobacter sp. VKM Ac-2978]|uniref:AAA family ATPase n=1 Tax=Modestobacter sp. VKM Ac-2978 TaxID=3004132 RepID=UPI0022AB125D|nr:AAA family ATPase [Modestobacter sp. VKM Ac-2978]MCZ2846453.1 AAA family ATPase [Modestobacter sp. VKM Ac-2978]